MRTVLKFILRKMSRSGNFTLRRFNAEKERPTTAASEDILLAQMEIFIIVVAVIAVAAAIILLVLLQLRIKKQTTAETSTTEMSQGTRVQTGVVEEIALDYPNDEILKNGPPPYRQVMISPELYPLASSKGTGDVKIQIPTSPVRNQRTKRTWNQFLNAVLHYDDDQGLNTPSGRYTSGKNTCTSKNSYIHNSAAIDEMLPSYDEVTCEETKVESCQNSLPRRESADIGKYNFLGFNFGIEKTKICKNDCVFTTFNALQTVITAEELKQSSRRPRLATL